MRAADPGSRPWARPRPPSRSRCAARPESALGNRRRAGRSGHRIAAGVASPPRLGPMDARTTPPLASLVVLVLACGDSPDAGDDGTDEASETTGSASGDETPTASADDASDPSAMTLDDDGSSGADDAPGDSTDDDGSTTGAPSRQCDDPAPPGLPEGAPALVPGEWTDLT